jgi:hypothetical protein
LKTPGDSPRRHAYDERFALPAAPAQRSGADPTTAAGELERDSATDAAPAAGDQREFAGE